MVRCALSRESVHSPSTPRHLRGGDDGGRGGGPVRVVADTVGLQTEPRVLLLEPISCAFFLQSSAISCETVRTGVPPPWRDSPRAETRAAFFVGDATRPRPSSRTTPRFPREGVPTRRFSTSWRRRPPPIVPALPTFEAFPRSPNLPARFQLWLGDSALCCIAARRVRSAPPSRRRCVLDATILPSYALSSSCMRMIAGRSLSQALARS